MYNHRIKQLLMKYTFESVITNTSLFIFGGGEADEHNNDDNNKEIKKTF